MPKPQKLTLTPGKTAPSDPPVPRFGYIGHARSRSAMRRQRIVCFSLSAHERNPFQPEFPRGHRHQFSVIMGARRRKLGMTLPTYRPTKREASYVFGRLRNWPRSLVFSMNVAALTAKSGCENQSFHRPWPLSRRWPRVCCRRVECRRQDSSTCCVS